MHFSLLRLRFIATLAAQVLGFGSILAAGFTSQDIGAPPTAGATSPGPDDSLVLSGSGAGIGARGDQFHFAWQARSGDFDVQVRVGSVEGPDLLSQGGLVVRGTLERDSQFAAVVAGPSAAGLSFLAREGQSMVLAKRSGSLPGNHPDTWLRLQRKGDAMTGAASHDGRTWIQIGVATVTMTDPVYLGFGAASQQPQGSAVATFHGFGDATGDISPAVRSPLELPGPTSRRTGLVISEIMYHPASRNDGRDLEFVELFNSQSIFADLSGFRLSGTLDYTFPEGTVLPAGGFLVIAPVPQDVEAVYGLSGVLGGFTNRIDNAEGTIRLRNRIDAVLQEVTYGNQPPWPVAADGTGHSLVLLRPSFGEGNPKAWAASRATGGSPGRWDSVAADRFAPIVINEVFAASTAPDRDYVELYNHSNEPVDLSGIWISDRPANTKFQIPEGTTIEARGHLVFDETQLDFALSSAGEAVYLTTPARSRIIDAVRFGGQAQGVATGRSPDGAATVRALAARTPGAPNSRAWLGDVVINEIHYHPVSNQDDDEFVELYNRGLEPVDLGGWEFTTGIRYTFDPQTRIPAGGYLVVARNAARLRTKHPGLNANNCVGDYEGVLSNGGETLTLSRPAGVPDAGLNAQVTTSRVLIPVAEVTYADGGRWGQWADGGGSSLELIDPRADPAHPSNWADSDESEKGGWTLVEHTGVMDHSIGDPSYGPIMLQLFMEGVGECLVDDVEVIGPGGTNRVVNGNFESGLNGWFAQGSHSRSTLATDAGIEGSQCLHVRADSRGDPGANRIRVNVARGLTDGDTVTLRARVRWVRGFPEFLMRLRGNSLEAFGRLDTSSHLGTPGAANSRRVAAAPPAIYEVAHSPILPAADQPVVVTARFDAPHGSAALALRYREDPGTNLVEAAMLDDGTGGDAVAGDGVFSATIPGQPAGKMVAFHLQASRFPDARPAGTFPDAAPARECLVRFGEAQLGGTFGTYRIWMTDATRRAWTSRLKLDNSDLDVTFVYGNSRVIYNAGSHYVGSPFVSPGFSGPTGALCGYVVSFPKDDPFLGAGDLKLDWPVRDPALQMEQVAYWIADQLRLPTSHRRFVHLYVNGVKRGTVYEDSQQPNSDVVEQYFPDDVDGDLYKIDDWFEFDAGAAGFVNRDATLDNFTTTDGAKKLARYRWNWRKRAVQESANDYRSLFALVDAATTLDSPAFTEAVEAQMDVEEWMRVIALEHLVGNWDSFGYQRGKNMSAYKPVSGRWNLLMWDIDFVLSASGDSADSYLYSTIDPTISTMMFHPPFRRVYLRALADAAAGPLRTANFGPLLAANHRALLANGISPGLPTGGSNYLTARLRNVQNELNGLEQRFTVNVPGSSFTVTNNLLILTGTAPVKVKELRINGVPARVTWTSETEWTLQLPLSAATNTLQLAGFDSHGRAIGGFARTLTVRYPGTFDSAAGHLVFNEILHHPSVPGATFIELFNASTTTAFDLSGWWVSGLDFAFPPGSAILPGQHLVLTPSRVAFNEAYGPRVVPVAEFAGNLSSDGETLRLIRPGAVPAEDVVVAELTYDSRAPWPARANEGGISLQLKDPVQGQNRIGNWAVYSPPVVTECDRISVTGQVTNTANGVLIYLSGLPPVRDISTPAGRWEGYIDFNGFHSELGFDFRQLEDTRWEVDYVYTDSTGEVIPIPLGGMNVTNNLLRFGFGEGAQEFRVTMATNGLTMAGTYQPPNNPSYPVRLTRANPGGDVFVDDVFLARGSEPETGPNLLRNGGFETTLNDAWTVGASHAASAIDTERFHQGAASLHLAATAGGY
ncbi:MAG: lamin tail domain-containing protein, partial [Limisphaerales bacterium]